MSLNLVNNSKGKNIQDLNKSELIKKIEELEKRLQEKDYELMITKANLRQINLQLGVRKKIEENHRTYAENIKD